MADPDIRMYPHLHNVLVQRGQHMPRYFDVLIDPYDREETIVEAEREFQNITVPTYTGAGWYGYTYKTHLAGAQTYFSKIPAQKKMVLTGPASSRSAAAGAARRHAALVRPLAERHRHRNHERAAGDLLGHGREPMAPRRLIGRCRKRNGPSFISRAGSG